MRLKSFIRKISTDRLHFWSGVRFDNCKILMWTIHKKEFGKLWCSKWRLFRKKRFLEPCGVMLESERSKVSTRTQTKIDISKTCTCYIQYLTNSDVLMRSNEFFALAYGSPVFLKLFHIRLNWKSILSNQSVAEFDQTLDQSK